MTTTMKPQPLLRPQNQNRNQIKYMKGTDKYDIRSPHELIKFGLSVTDAISYFNIFQYYKTCSTPFTLVPETTLPLPSVTLVTNLDFNSELFLRSGSAELKSPKWSDLEHEYNMVQQTIIMKSIIQQVIKNKVENQIVDKNWVIRKWKNDY